VILTATDYPMARLLEEAGVKCIHVGDSLGMVALGYPDTISVKLDEILHHLRAVARACKRALITADVPACCMESPEKALFCAEKLIENGAHAVKLEGGQDIKEHIFSIVKKGIPVMGHIGLLPQRARHPSAYRKYGTNSYEAEQLIQDAIFLEQAGCFSIVLECVQKQVAEKITRMLKIPTIGIYSGNNCDAQIRVTHDLLGLSPWSAPKSNRPLVDLAHEIKKTVGLFRSTLLTSRVSKNPSAE